MTQSNTSSFYRLKKFQYSSIFTDWLGGRETDTWYRRLVQVCCGGSITRHVFGGQIGATHTNLEYMYLFTQQFRF